jgi:hypothetical protein
MIKAALPLILIFTVCSCGLVGVYKDNISYDPEFRTRVIREIHDKPIGKTMDSLITRIDAAKSTFPNDLPEHPLILETFRYEEFLSIQQNKFSTLKDSPKSRRNFKRYDAARKKGRLIRNPKFTMAYMDKDQYSVLDSQKYPYVLKTTYRLDYETEELVVTVDGNVYPWGATMVYYIMDRRTKEVYGPIASVKDLSNK